tara:strand:+ start:134758 stop:136311 length:1554 start_codon:yes stop_codon:yes gene_type:complete
MSSPEARLHILMVAAENAALPGGKVGGMGDVLRDLPRALADRGHRVTVLTPAHAPFLGLPGASAGSVFEAPFAGSPQRCRVWQLPAPRAHAGVSYLGLEYPGLASCGEGRIYCDDGAQRPFASDATRYARFCSAVAQALTAGLLPWPDVVHLHDWHTAGLAVLARGYPRFAPLQALRWVYTIHNLALQGIRPLRGDASSLEAWFPGLYFDPAWIGDPRYADCYNPMRAGITLCQRVHAVSPHYAREILGEAGEGLTGDLRLAEAQGRLVGILNGCEYPAPEMPGRGFPWLAALLSEQVERWLREQPGQGVHQLARRRLAALRDSGSEPPGTLLTSVGRLTDQKVRLLEQAMPDGRSCLAHVLDCLGPGDRLLVLGSGDPAKEQFFHAVAEADERLLFLCGYSETLADPIYASGDLFLMPSSFEPCGISQMLAMRAGQPCLVHAVGGLVDTVTDGVNGFRFSGDSDPARAAALLERLETALRLRRQQPRRWRALVEAARATRFPWSDAARACELRLYR